MPERLERLEKLEGVVAQCRWEVCHADSRGSGGSRGRRRSGPY
jgi:hypothetical protein